IMPNGPPSDIHVTGSTKLPQPMAEPKAIAQTQCILNDFSSVCWLSWETVDELMALLLGVDLRRDWDLAVSWITRGYRNSSFKWYQWYRPRWPMRRNGANARERIALNTFGYSSSEL